jgi:glycosyltransferase involved in cell wall biosynthesis
MVEAMRALPDCRLVVLGWGWLEGEMRAAAPENVVFLPPVPETDLVATLSGADAGLLPIEAKNRSKEHSQANKLFEYLMAGLPIVATDLPGHRIVLAGTGAAVFVPEATSGAIALGVRELFMRDDESPGAFSRAARKAAERYSLERETPELLRVVEACLRGT